MTNKKKRKKSKEKYMKKALELHQVTSKEENEKRPLHIRLHNKKKYACIFATNNPDHLILATPIFKKLYYMTQAKVNVFMGHVFNTSYIPFISELPYVESVNILQDNNLNNETMAEIQKDYDVVVMMNYAMAMQQGIQKGITATQALAWLINFQMDPEETLILDIGINDEYFEKAIETMSSSPIEGEYVVFAPHFAPNIPPQLKAQQEWPLEMQFELLSRLEDLGLSVVVIGDSAHDKSIIPEGISDKITSVYTDDYRLLAGIIGNSIGVICPDNWYCVLARAFLKPIVQIHSGGPVFWSGAMYPKASEHAGSTRMLASISIRSIGVDDVIKASKDIFSNFIECKQNKGESVEISVSNVQGSL